MTTRSKFSTYAAASIGVLTVFMAIGTAAKPVKAETFSIQGFALNTNNNIRRYDTFPEVLTWALNSNDPDMNFSKVASNFAGTSMLQNKTTQGCVNSHYGVGSKTNVWSPCNKSDPDMAWKFLGQNDGKTLIQNYRSGLCLEMPNKANYGVVVMQPCNANNANQRWTIGGGSSGSTINIPVNWNSSAYRQDNPLWRRFAPPSVGGTLDAQGNCTWYANGRLRELGYSANDLRTLTGNANYWITQARNAGIPTGKTAQVGAIAQWVGSNHVAVVEQVNTDGTILISESSYKYSGAPNGYLYKTRTIKANSVDNYIYVRR